MKPKARMLVLGAYDALLALGAIALGVQMIEGTHGIFAEYPKEWLGKVPFASWVAPGIVAIAVFGLGNLAAAAFCFLKTGGKAWMPTAAMGAVFLASLVAQIFILGEWYLATVEFFLLSILQLGLCAYAAFGRKGRTA